VRPRFTHHPPAVKRLLGRPLPPPGHKGGVAVGRDRLPRLADAVELVLAQQALLELGAPELPLHVADPPDRRLDKVYDKVRLCRERLVGLGVAHGTVGIERKRGRGREGGNETRRRGVGRKRKNRPLLVRSEIDTLILNTSTIHSSCHSFQFQEPVQGAPECKARTFGVRKQKSKKYAELGDLTC
jgi:hypothetical protein